MAISRSQQPRQNYGLGSFVKKITKPFTKVAQKIVPKEIAGIARIASPFLGPVAGPLAYLAGTAKQKGRISGLDLGVAAAPFLARRYDLGGKIRENVPGGDKFMTRLFGAPKTEGSYIPDAVGSRLETSTMIDSPLNDFTARGLPVDPGTISTSSIIPGEQVFIPGTDATQGFLGSGGKMASLFGDAEKGIPSISKTGLTDLLFRKDIVDKAGIKTGKKGLDYLKLAGWTTGIYSAIEAGKYNDELEAAAAAEAAAEADGATDTEVQASIDWAKATFGRLSRADIGLAQGGRVNYAMGTGPVLPPDPTKPVNPFAPKPTGPVLPNKEMAMSYGYDDAMSDTYSLFLQMKENKKIPIEMDFDEFLMEVVPEMSKKQTMEDRPMAANGGRIGYAEGTEEPLEPINIGIGTFNPQRVVELYEKAKNIPKNISSKNISLEDIKSIPKRLMEGTKSSISSMVEPLGNEYRAYMEFFSLPEKDKKKMEEMGLGIFDVFEYLAMRDNKAQGGLMRTNYALGTKPEPKESGLGGLPIEADMRYSGGFMPYGKKEKADDVPARLSKNEFVFTADAVRAAGGGSMNEGARKMYQTMKMLEQKNRMMS